MTAYRKGVAFEYATRDYLHKEGYEVFRSAGSHTKVDLTAVKHEQILFVQCKVDAKIPPDERRKLWELASLIDCAIPVLAWKVPGEAQVLLAELTGVGPQDRIPFLTDEVVA